MTSILIKVSAIVDFVLAIFSSEIGKRLFHSLVSLLMSLKSFASFCTQTLVGALPAVVRV